MQQKCKVMQTNILCRWRFSTRQNAVNLWRVFVWIKSASTRLAVS